MLFNLLEAAAASENFGERAASGGFTFILGMIVIFVGMTVLILCVTGFGVAIIAAIAAYYAESGSKNEFKVRKIKKL